MTDLGDVCIIDGKRETNEHKACTYAISELVKLGVKLDIAIIITAHIIEDRTSRSVTLPSLPKSIKDALDVTMADREKLLSMPGMEWESGRVPKLNQIYGGKRLGQKASMVLGISRNLTAKDEDELFTTNVKIIKTREEKGSINKTFKLRYSPNKLRLEEL